MKNVLIGAKPLSSISLSMERQAKSPKTLDYIPGSSLRGALARRYLDTFGRDGDFEELFLNKRVVFPNLYPSTKDIPGYVLPLTSAACKRWKETHGIEDTLYLKGAEVLSNKEKGILPNGIDVYYLCKKCHQDLRPLQGYWYEDKKNPEIARVSKSLRLHTGIDRATETVKESILYGIEAINSKGKNGENILLSGCTELPEASIDKIRQLLSETFFIGKAKTRGYGEVEFYLKEDIVPQKMLNTERLKKWDESFKVYCKEKFGLNPEGFYFAITFQSDAILIDRFLRPTLELNIGFNDIECILKMARAVTVRGWNIAHRLPKEDEGGAAKGSTYLFHYTGHDLDRLSSHLQSFQSNGVGLRKNEGFGGLTISNPFHSNLAIRRN